MPFTFRLTRKRRKILPLPSNRKYYMLFPFDIFKSSRSTCQIGKYYRYHEIWSPILDNWYICIWSFPLVNDNDNGRVLMMLVEQFREHISLVDYTWHARSAVELFLSTLCCPSEMSQPPSAIIFVRVFCCTQLRTDRQFKTVCKCLVAFRRPVGLYWEHSFSRRCIV